MPEPEYPCQPPMTPFKQFLSTQDDSISEEEAVKRYNQYKLDFKKTQLNEYFLAHKHEEWWVAMMLFVNLRSAMILTIFFLTLVVVPPQGVHDWRLRINSRFPDKLLSWLKIYSIKIEVSSINTQVCRFVCNVYY